MKIGILGSGDVGKTLAQGFIKHNHEALIGTRETAKLEEWQAKNPKVRLGTPADAARFGDTILLAVKGSATSAALHGAGVDNLTGKTIIDAANEGLRNRVLRTNG